MEKFLESKPSGSEEVGIDNVDKQELALIRLEYKQD